MTPTAAAPAAVVRVNLGPRSYDIRVGPGGIGRLGEWLRTVAPAKTCALISDSHAARLWAPAAEESLRAAGYRVVVAEFPAGEASKDWATAGRLLDRLLADPGLDRRSPFVAVGGGVTGDLVGFVSSIFKRGTPFVQVPTTLLAQVDAGVGGKTGVNHATGKNLVGTVHQPVLVVADVLTLRTLPDAEFADGLAEVVKHALISDAALFDRLEADADRIVSGRAGDPAWPALMTELVAANCRIKARVVEADETETGLRGILNYGHTVGHALEAVAGYGRLSHGKAVSIGLVAEARIARRRGMVGADVIDRQARLLARLGLPTEPPAADADAVMAALRQDKKSRDGRVSFVLPTALGAVEFRNDVTEDEIRAVLSPR